MWKSVSIIVVMLLAITLYNAIYFLPEGTQAVVTQFGEIKGEPVKEAGIKFKVPFLQDVRLFDKRILNWDGDREQIPTKDKKYIWVDTTARWRIIDPIKFTQTLRDERQARTTLDSILDGVTRDTISNNRLVEAVRNSNAIIEKIKASQEAIEAATKQREQNADETATIYDIEAEEEITGDVPEIAIGREKLSEMIIKRARNELNSFGIELIDVQLRSIAYEESVQKKVFDRMISERKKIAEKIRSIGQGEHQKIKGKLNQDLKKIESIAYKKSQEIKGEAEAQAIKIYADAFGSDPDFYEFSKKLEAYNLTLAKKGQLIISTDSEFIKLFNTGK